MNKKIVSNQRIRKWLILAPISFIALLLIVWIAPTFVPSNAQTDQDKAENVNKRKDQNFDIRTDNSEAARQMAEQKRQKFGQSKTNRIADLERGMKTAENRLKSKNPGVEVEMSKEIGAPEIVGVMTGGKKLTARSGARREDVVRGFVSGNSDLYGLTKSQVAQLKKTADYENPAGNMSFVEFEQEIGGIPVFQGSLRAGLTKDGELIRTTGRLVPGLDYEAVKQEKADYTANKGGESSAAAASSAASAVAAGANSIGVSVNPADLVVKEVSEDGMSYVFEGGPFVEDIKAEMVYFPLNSGAVTLSWSMVLWQDTPAYYTLVDANGGTLLWRKNITEDQMQPATYNVYADESPAPFSPLSPISGFVPNGFQAPLVPRTDFTLVSELPAFDNLGWITDGGTTTTGNNVDAGLDVVAPNGIDAGSRPVSATRQFVFSYNPATDAPSTANYRAGAVTNLFFWTNRYHDILYQYGFTEASRNFQGNNFGRGGLGNDFVRAEAQDFSGTNNANFSTGPDGSQPRMQMYVWTGPSPDYDGDLDQTISIHEMTHGTSNRLHNNASGLGVTVSRGMGEGWSDFYARAILSSADEDVDGIFSTGGYATHLGTAGYTNNYYYGIRRFPHAVKTNLGSNGKPHNPLTLDDTNPNKIDLTDGAFARGPFGAGGRAGAVAVHNIGEVWSMALFEVRARLIHRLGYAAGNQRMMQLVTDAMKLDPVNPTLLDGRNSLLAADVAFSSEDALDIWAGFASRGMGFGAAMSVTNADGKESFDNPIPGMGNVTFTDCSGNGKADVGETLTLSVPLTNPLSQTLTGVSAHAVGGDPVNFGTIAPGATVTQNISYQVPADAICGSQITVSIVVDSNLGQQTKTFTLRLGTPVLTNLQNFDGVTAPALPAGWTSSTNGAGTPWTTSVVASDTAPNAAGITLAATTGTSQLLSPAISVPATGSNQLTFRHSFNSEFEWDGGIVAISINGGSFFDILDAGGSFDTGGYTFALTRTVDGNTNATLQGRAAWTGNSGGFITSTINLPAAAAGQSVRLLFIGGSDSAFTPVGAHWRIDSISMINSYACASEATTTTVAAATVQYSDQVTLSATISGNCGNPSGNIQFIINGNPVGAPVPVSGNGTYTLPYTVTLAPGGYPIVANFVSTNPYYQNSSGSNTLTVTKENASVAFPSSNPFAVKVNTAGGTAGPITICADITEVSDLSAGDTSNATATFSFSPVAGGSAPTPGAVTYSGGGVGGTRRACTIVSNVSVNVYDITVTVGNYYTGSSSTVLAVYDPSLGFVTGGGTIINNGNVANFGINIKYNKNGKPQGSLLYIEHRPGGVVKIKSNALDSMSIVNNTAVILTKATVNGVGNHNIRMTVVDNGEPGSSDQLALQTTSPSNANVPDLTFGLTTLRGGNIQVPKIR